MRVRVLVLGAFALFTATLVVAAMSATGELDALVPLVPFVLAFATLFALGIALLQKLREQHNDIRLIRDRSAQTASIVRAQRYLNKAILGELVSGALSSVPAQVHAIHTRVEKSARSLQDGQESLQNALESRILDAEERLETGYTTVGETILTHVLQAQHELEAIKSQAQHELEAIKSQAQHELEAIKRAEASVTDGMRIGLNNQYRQVESLLALYRLLGISDPLPPLRDWAVSPDLARFLVETVLSHSPETVVEFGSGTSTVLIALCLKHLGTGHITAFEHLPEYVAATEQMLQAAGADDWASVIHAPLVDRRFGDVEVRWYDLDLDDLPDPVDIVVVDGPPSTSGPLARYPAVPMLIDRLASDGMVLLDDCNRPTEQEIVERWTSESFGLRSQYLDHEKGTAVLTRIPGDEPTNQGMHETGGVDEEST